MNVSSSEWKNWHKFLIIISSETIVYNGNNFPMNHRFPDDAFQSLIYEQIENTNVAWYLNVVVFCVKRNETSISSANSFAGLLKQ